MREIKFRAWNTNNNRMYFDVQNGIDLGLYIGFGDALTQINLKVMQYTGLKDKNKVDVYEGDVLLNEFGKKVVRWSEAAGAFYLDEFESTIMQIWFWSVDFEKLEVIGNIYSNPELLTPTP